MPKGNQPPIILWLASWYPCRLDPFNGDFVQRSAKALAMKLPVQVLYIMKDEAGIITKSHIVESEKIGLLTETRIYYHPFKSGFTALDKVISAWHYTRLGRRWLKRFRQQQDPNQPWIVEVAIAMRAGTLGLWMKRKWKQSYLVQEHWTGYYKYRMPPDLQKGPLFWNMNLKVLKHSDALLPDSRHLGEWINSEFMPIRFREIPNTVDTSLFYFNQGIKPEGIFRFIHVSTLGYQKNTEGILRCFNNLLETIPGKSFELLVVGPGFEQHQQWVNRQPGLSEKVIFTGAKPYREVAELMQSANALVLFSRFENLPCVMLEAFCCGLPVIASRVGGIHYHLPEQNGILVESENEEQLLIALGQMVNHYENYIGWQIAENAAGKYGMPAIADLYIEIYSEFYPRILAKSDILVS